MCRDGDVRTLTLISHKHTHTMSVADCAAGRREAELANAPWARAPCSRRARPCPQLEAPVPPPSRRRVPHSRPASRLAHRAAPLRMCADVRPASRAAGGEKEMGAPTLRYSATRKTRHGDTKADGEKGHARKDIVAGRALGTGSIRDPHQVRPPYGDSHRARTQDHRAAVVRETATAGQPPSLLHPGAPEGRSGSQQGAGRRRRGPPQAPTPNSSSAAHAQPSAPLAARKRLCKRRRAIRRLARGC